MFSTNKFHKIRYRLVSNLDVYAGVYEFEYYLDTNHPASSLSQFFSTISKMNMLQAYPCVFLKFCMIILNKI